MAKKNTVAVLSEAAMSGPEPMWIGIATQGQLADYLTWCNRRLELSAAAAAVIKFLQNNNLSIDGVKDLPDYEFQTVGFIARLLNMKDNRRLDDYTMNRFYMKLKALQEKVPSQSVRRPSVTYKDDKLERGLERCESVFDSIITDNEFSDTLLNDFLSVKIAEAYLPTLVKSLDEMNLALSGKDEEVKEGYANYSTKRLKEITWELTKFKTALETFIVKTPKQSTVRKPRIKKPKPADKQIKKLKFAEKDDKYNVQSIDPRKIVGAKEIWLFNTVYRKITVLRSDVGFSVKGTSVYGFDEKTSFTKKLRKPELFLPEIVNGGKVSARKSFDALKVVQSQAHGRINAETIILRVFN